MSLFENLLHAAIQLSKVHPPWYDYKSAWYNFIFVRPNTHTWFIKYSKELKNTIIPNDFTNGGISTGIQTEHQLQFEKFQVERNISILSENTKIEILYCQKDLLYY